MKAFLLFLSGFLLQLPAAVVFPPNRTVVSNACNLPNTLPAPNGSEPRSLTFTLRTDSETVTFYGQSERNSFIPFNIYTINANPNSDGNVTVPINASVLAYGANKTSIALFSAGASTYFAYLTIEIDCTPGSTITLVPDSTALQVAQGSAPTSILLNGAVKGNAGLGYATNPISFVMTPDTPPSVSPWLVSGSVPGSPANTGTVKQNGAADLTVSVNPAGLAVQPAPYVGFLHIRDQKTGYGSADLTVQLTVTAATTGNATLPHIAVNNVYVTDFSIVNTGAQTANFAINFLDDSGNPLSVLVQGKGVVSGVSGNLPANGTALFEAGDPNLPNVTGGSARVIADASIGVQAAFRLHVQDGTGNHYYEAAVPATTGSQEFLIPFDFTKFAPTGEQLYTGIAIANLDSANAANVSCVATDSSGNVVPNAASIPNIGPNGHWAGFNFPALIGKQGRLDCTGTTVIGAIALHAYAVSGAISSLPVFLK
jgi:hypothetical protein